MKKEIERLKKIIEKYLPQGLEDDAISMVAEHLLNDVESEIESLQKENKNLESKYNELHKLVYGFAESFKVHHNTHFPPDPEY